MGFSKHRHAASRNRFVAAKSPTNKLSLKCGGSHPQNRVFVVSRLYQGILKITAGYYPIKDIVPSQSYGLPKLDLCLCIYSTRIKFTDVVHTSEKLKWQ